MTNLQYFKQLNAMLLSYKEGKTQSNDLLVGIRMLNLEAGGSNLSIKLVDPQTELERLDATKQLELRTIPNTGTTDEDEDQDQEDEEDGDQESYEEEEEEDSYSLSYEEEEEEVEESYDEEEEDEVEAGK